MPDGPAADVRLGHLMHLDGGHHARGHAGLFERVLQRQRVDHGGQHAHVIRRHAIHVHGRRRHAAKEIAAAHHQPDLHAGAGDFGDLLRQAFTRSGSMPKELPPASTSPLSFRRMRWYLGMAGDLRAARALRLRRGVCSAVSSMSAASPTLKRTKRDTEMFSPSLAIVGFDQVADGGGVFVNERLLVEADLFVELGQPAFDDLVHHLLGLAFLQRARALDVAALCPERLGVTSSLRMNCGSAAATCMARSFTRL